MTERLTGERIDAIYSDIQTWVETDVNSIDRVDLLTAMFELREDNAALRADNVSLYASLQGEAQFAEELREALASLLEVYSKPDRRMCCNWQDCGCQGSTVYQEAEHYARAALAQEDQG